MEVPLARINCLPIGIIIIFMCWIQLQRICQMRAEFFEEFFEEFHSFIIPVWYINMLKRRWQSLGKTKEFFCFPVGKSRSPHLCFVPLFLYIIILPKRKQIKQFSYLNIWKCRAFYYWHNIIGQLITTWTKWGGRGSTNVCFLSTLRV